MRQQKFTFEHMTMGVDYYPEQWDRSLWEEDLQRMLACGITVIRIAEFSWNLVEPEEGIFTYDFYDEFLDICERMGMKVIFGTPTAAPPAWLTKKYPEVLNHTIDGTAYEHGGRRHYTYNSPIYQALSARIVEKEASHYGKHPALIGWQIDNEFNCHLAEFYSAADEEAFIQFLQNKYHTLKALNHAWGTVFWNQTYTNWDEVTLPRLVPDDSVNPHMHLDYVRFISESTIAYCKMQADIIRKYCKKGDFITTNGRFSNVDNHRMSDTCLDWFSYDSYPNFAYTLDKGKVDPDGINDRWHIQNLTEIRSICPHFGIMEQQAGPGGWTTRMEMPAPRPGQMTLWTMQSIAHGADFICYFRWRTALFGTEMYWHGILGYDNADNRRLAEVQEIAKRMKALEPTAGAKVCAPFAIFKDYDNVFDAQIDRWHARLERQSEEGLFKAALEDHTMYDFVYMSDDLCAADLQQYKVIIWPHPVISDAKESELLGEYVRKGGILILGCRAGLKDRNGHCVMRTQPGTWSEMTGTTVCDYTFTSPAEEEVKARTADASFAAPVFNDVLVPMEGTKVLAVYDNSYYAGEAALTEHVYGKGKVLHLGSTFSCEAAHWLYAYTGIAEPLQMMMQLPQQTEAVKKEKNGKTYIFVQNYSMQEKTIQLRVPMKDLFNKKTAEGEMKLPAFGSVVYEVM